MTRVGNSNISAQVVADSIDWSGNFRITTYQLHYPRFIHAEFMTHRMFSRNASSSRAIPATSMVDSIRSNRADFVHWGKNQAGMVAHDELSLEATEVAQSLWEQACESALKYSLDLKDLEVHKQIANRVTEPYQHMNVVVTATEYENFFWLRNHPDAQPEIQELAKCMLEARELSIPKVVGFGQWHLPYVTADYINNTYFVDGAEVSLETALKVSASACAQVSYRKNDLSLEKAEKIWNQLIFSTPCHASPVEHQATPTYSSVDDTVWPEGATHIDKEGIYWSGNFKGWIQHRKLLPNESVW